MPPTLTWLRDLDGEYATFHLICEHTIVGRQPREPGQETFRSPSRYDWFQFRIGDTLYIGVGDMAMSRTHFAIRRAENEYGGDRFWIRDLRSRSGIMVNDVRNDADHEIPLQGGEKIRAGGARLLFNLW